MVLWRRIVMGYHQTAFDEIGHCPAVEAGARGMLVEKGSQWKI